MEFEFQRSQNNINVAIYSTFKDSKWPIAYQEQQLAYCDRN